MNIGARRATPTDLAELVRLYRRLADEMRGYHAMWERADGLPEPVDESLSRALADPDTVVYLGTIDEVVFGEGNLRIPSVDTR